MAILITRADDDCSDDCEDKDDSVPICAMFDTSNETRSFPSNCEFEYGQCIGSISKNWKKIYDHECV